MQGDMIPWYIRVLDKSRSRHADNTGHQLFCMHLQAIKEPDVSVSCVRTTFIVEL